MVDANSFGCRMSIMGGEDRNQREQSPFLMATFVVDTRLQM